MAFWSVNSSRQDQRDMNPAHSSLHMVMYPWFGLGHITPYLHISNKLAGKGHRISFFVPAKTQSKIQHFNRSPDLITFVPITVPPVDGLPLGAETTADVPAPLIPLIMTAMDRTERDVELLLRELKPHIIFFDFTHWIPKLARRLQIKSVYLSVMSPLMLAYFSGRERQEKEMSIPLEKMLLQPPSGFPDSSIKLRPHEIPFFVGKKSTSFGDYDMKLPDRLDVCSKECDAFVSKGCKEIEGPFVEFIEGNLGKPILLAGPIIPEPPISSFGLEEKWVKFLGGFEAGSVVFCAFGSECILQKDQFQELLLGLELSGVPFLVALKPPSGTKTIEEALPDGFEGRVEGRGVVHGGWIQQQLILEHPSVGCFITHCGYGSLMEGLVKSNISCQLVMIPNESDQIFNARLIGNTLKAGVEVEKREEDGFFTRESVCKATRTVMEENYSEVGREVRANKAKLRELLLSQDLESSCVNNLSQKLQALVR